MKFLVIFLALLAIWKLPKRTIESKATGRWIELWQKLGFWKSLPSAVQFFVIALLPSVLIFYAFYRLDSVLWGLPSLILEIALVFYVLIHADVQQHIENYQKRVTEKDYQAAFLCAQQRLGLPNVQGETLDSAEKITPLVIRSLLYRWFQYFFLPLFWYLIADVGGILLVWLSLQYSRQYQNPTAQQVLRWLEAIPVRLLALTYGLAGNLTHALPVWKEYLKQWHEDHAELLFTVAQSALLHVPSSAEIAPEWHRLHRYSVSIWLVIIAIATLGGWLL